MVYYSSQATSELDTASLLVLRERIPQEERNGDNEMLHGGQPLPAPVQRGMHRFLNFFFMFYFFFWRGGTLYSVYVEIFFGTLWWYGGY